MSTDSFDRRSLMALFAGASATLLTSIVSAAENPADEEPKFEPSGSPSDANLQLQAIGSLGVGHIQSTLGLIGVIADSLSKDLYTQKQIEDLMNGTFNSLEAPKRILRRLQDSNVSGEDAEFIDRMISVLNALQREARALAAYSKSRRQDDAALFEKARRQALKKLGDLTQQDELLHSDSTSRRTPPSTNEKPVELSN